MIIIITILYELPLWSTDLQVLKKGPTAFLPLFFQAFRGKRSFPSNHWNDPCEIKSG
jgi:hypothetical protein